MHPSISSITRTDLGIDATNGHQAKEKLFACILSEGCHSKGISHLKIFKPLYRRVFLVLINFQSNSVQFSFSDLQIHSMHIGHLNCSLLIACIIKLHIAQSHNCTNEYYDITRHIGQYRNHVFLSITKACVETKNHDYVIMQ